MQGLIMDMPLLVFGPLEHAARYHSDTEVVARTVEGGLHRYTYAEVQARAKRLSGALRRLGVREGERVGSLAWNTHRHLEAYYGVPGSGAVLNTLNPRLSAAQLAYVINHAENRVLLVDAGTLPLLENAWPELRTVERVVMMTDRATMPARSAVPGLLCYEELLAAERDDVAWPDCDERTASMICYTSGTTGNPKGVVYSHRAIILVTLLYLSYLAPGSRNGAREVLMPLAPMFHVNAWFFPYLAPMTGAKLVLPGRSYEPEQLWELFEGEGVTITCGVPTHWLILEDWLRRTGKTLSTLRLSYSSGSTPPRWLIETLERQHGVELVQSWGMTEAPGGSHALAVPGSAELDFGARIAHRQNSGRAMYGVQYRLLDDEGRALPHDGRHVGHLRVKGPWIAAGYYRDETGSALDDEGWLITGDIASIDAHGYIRITDRAKDLIKSGGEWISSQELESIAVAHPDVLQAAVIAVSHPKWQERPLLIVVPRADARPTAEALREHMRGKVADWWLPDDIVFVDELPMTGSGKIQKTALRERYKDYRLPAAADTGHLRPAR